MPPMLARAASRHGSCCGGPPGIDCAEYGRSKSAQRHIEKARWEREQAPAGRSVGDDEDDDG